MSATPMVRVEEKDLPDSITGAHRQRIFVREINVVGRQTQYLCMFEDGVNCFASAFSLAHLAQAIERRQAYEDETVADYEPALAGLGLSFARSVSGSIVMQEVRNEAGELLGIADMRKDAVEMALVATLAGRQPASMSSDEFRKIAFAARVTKQGRHGFVYEGGIGDHPEITQAAKIMWFLDKAVRQAHPVLKDFVPWLRASILRSQPVQGMASSDVTHMVCGVGNGRHLHFVFVKGSRLSLNNACALAHQSLVESAAKHPD